MSQSITVTFPPARRPPLHQCSLRRPNLGSKPLNNHLCNTLSTQRLATHEPLPLESSDKIAGCCKQQDNCCRNQARGINDDAKPLDQAHGTIDSCTHVVGSETSDESVKSGRSWAYAEEQGYLNEDECETRAATYVSSVRFSHRAH